MEQSSFLFREGVQGATPPPEAPARQPPPEVGPPLEEAGGEPPAAETPTAPRILTVSEVVRAAKALMEGTFGDVWITGEVSGFRPSSAGHWYFDLKDESSVLTAVCFRPVAQSFGFKVENGLELIAHGRLSIYDKSGKFQIILDYCEPKGIGALQLAYEQLKERLAKEGLFDPRRKKPLPFCPRRIGVVTSPTGAAIRDILNILGRRFPACDVLLAPARVQGEGAAEEIAAAIAQLDHTGGCDVLIVGRGGGSLEDLWAFNEEIVARTIVAARTPIVSAVGHEVDFTIADFVADLRAPTPSAAAELVVPSQAELLAGVRDARRRLGIGIKRSWQIRAQQWREWHGRMKPPTARFPDWLQQIDHCRERLVFGTRTQLEQQRARLTQLAVELHHLSPLTILAKGYAVVCKRGTIRPVRRAEELHGGDRIDVRLHEGTIAARIE